MGRDMVTAAVGEGGCRQASRQALEEEFPVESRVVEEIQSQTVEQASAPPAPPCPALLPSAAPLHH